MAHVANSRTVSGELGGKHLQNHKLVPDATAQPRFNTQRTSSTKTAPNSLHSAEGRGDGQDVDEDATDADEEDDEATLQDDDETDDDIPLLYRGRGKGKGKGKGPAIHIEPVDDDETDKDDDETSSVGTGLIPSKHPVNQLLMQNKKRTFSNLSSTSLLFGDDTTDQDVFPRRKMARKLSNVGAKPILTYQESETNEHAIDSDDEDYSGVNLIPDDDDIDLDTMEQQEENFIAQEQEQQATALLNQLNQIRDARRLSLESSASDDIFDVTAPLTESYMTGLADIGFAPFWEPEAVPASPDPAAKRKYSDSSTKRVRFDDEVQVSEESESESSEIDDSVFPDLFLEQDQLPPILTKLLEAENDYDNSDVGSPMSDASFWDFNHDEGRITQADDSDDESSAGSSGYETDEGDTTDEEDFGAESDAPPQTPLQRKSVLLQPQSAPGSRAGTPKPFARSNRPTGRQIPPMRGVFVHKEHNAAIAITNRATKTVTFYRPRVQTIPWIPINGTHSSTSSTANNSPRASLAQFANVSDSEAEAMNNALSTDIMLTGIFGSAPGNDYFSNMDNIGPPEAFYPFVSLGSNGSMEGFDEDDFESEDYEDDLNIGDFMDFGDDSDSDMEADGEETDAPTTPGASQSIGATTAETPTDETPGNRKRTTSDVYLEHFDRRGVVTAFRNNQNRYRDVASLPSDPTARNAVSRPVRSGKSADALITPLRKRSKSNRVAKSPMAPIPQSSPLASVSKGSGTMAAPRRPPPRMGTFS